MNELEEKHSTPESMLIYMMIFLVFFSLAVSSVQESGCQYRQDEVYLQKSGVNCYFVYFSLSYGHSIEPYLGCSKCYKIKVKLRSKACPSLLCFLRNVL